MLNQLFFFSLTFSVVATLFGGWWTGMRLRYGWRNHKNGLSQIFHILNKATGYKILLWGIILLTTGFCVSYFLIVLFTLFDPWGTHWFTTVSYSPPKIETPLGALTRENQNLWLFTLILGVVGLKTSTLILRLVMVLTSDILVVGKNGKWGPASKILYTY